MQPSEIGMTREEFLAARVWYMHDEVAPRGGIGWIQKSDGEKVVIVGNSYRERYAFWRGVLATDAEREASFSASQTV